MFIPVNSRSALASCRSGIAREFALRCGSRLGCSRLVLRDLRLSHGVAEIGRDAGRERVRRLSEQALELDVGAAPELVLLRRNTGAKVFQRLRRQLAVLRRERFKHMEIVEVAKRLAKIVQGFGLGVQRLGPRAGKKRELVAQVNNAGAKRMQRNRVVAVEGEAPALARLPIGARDRGADLLGSDRAKVPSLDAPDNRVEPRSWRSGGEATASALSRLS